MEDIKEFFKRPETRKAIFLSLWVALILVAVDMIRRAIELLVNWYFLGAKIEDVVNSYGYLVGALAAEVIIMWFIHRTAYPGNFSGP